MLAVEQHIDGAAPPVFPTRRGEGDHGAAHLPGTEPAREVGLESGRLGRRVLSLSVHDAYATMSQMLGPSEKCLEPGFCFFEIETVQIEVRLNGIVSFFELPQVETPSLRGRSLDAFTGRERVQFSTAGHQFPESRQSFRLVAGTFGDLDGSGEPERCFAPPEWPDLLHGLAERFFVGERIINFRDLRRRFQFVSLGRKPDLP